MPPGDVMAGEKLTIRTIYIPLSTRNGCYWAKCLYPLESNWIRRMRESDTDFAMPLLHDSNPWSHDISSPGVNFEEPNSWLREMKNVIALSVYCLCSFFVACCMLGAKSPRKSPLSYAPGLPYVFSTNVAFALIISLIFQATSTFLRLHVKNVS